VTLGPGRERSAARASAWRLLVDATVRAEPTGVAMVVASGVVWMVAAALVPAILGRAIDRGVVGGDGRALAAWIAVFVAVAAVEAGAGAVRHWYATRNGERATARLRQRMVVHLHGLDSHSHERWTAGELLARVTSDAQHVGVMADVVGHTSGYAAGVVVVAGVLARIDAVLGALVLGPALSVAVIYWRYGDRYRARSSELAARLAEAATVVTDTVAGVRVVKGLGAGPAQSARYRATAAASREAGMALSRVEALFVPVLELMSGVALLAVVWVGGHRALEGRLSVGELVAFYAYVGLAVPALKTLATRVGTLQRALASAGRLAELVAEEPAVREPPSPRPLPAPSTERPRVGALVLDGVTFAHPGGLAVLSDVDLEVAAGARVALVGATGAGKSTLAGLFWRRHDPLTGSVRLDGVDLRDLALAELRRAVAVVSERPFLFSDTVRANLALADPGATDTAIERAASLAGAHEFVARLPDGYATVVGERGLTLSGGQRQRLALARAILADARVLVLDDATSSVDAVTDAEIRNRLADALAGRTTVLITHRAATAALADRVVLVAGGRVVAQGSHDELVERSPAYRSLLGGGPGLWEVAG